MERMLSVSMTHGEVAPHHDDRTNSPKNADPNKKKNDVFIRTCPDVRSAFNAMFADAVEEYNTGKRSDRQIKDYYEKIQECKRGKKSPHAVYEYVLQYGDMFNNNVNDPQFSQTTEDSTKMLVELAERLEQKYPQFKTMWSVVHCDEQTPHLHWAFTPVGTGYKNGMKEQCSLTKALNNMGYRNSGDRLALTQWQDDVKAVMVEIMEEHGYTREYKNNTEKHLSTDKFKQVKEVEQASEQLEQTQQQIAALADVMGKAPKQKRKGLSGMFQKTDEYTMNTQEHADYMQAADDMRRMSHNAVVSDEDREAAAADRAEAERMKHEQERIIKEQAERLARQLAQRAVQAAKQREQEAETAKQEAEQAKQQYATLKQREKAYILQEAAKIADKASASFRALDQKRKMAMLQEYIADGSIPKENKQQNFYDYGK